MAYTLDKITYYRLVSPYEQDETLDCGLNGLQIDANFMSLENSIITDLTWDATGNILKLVYNCGTAIAITGIIGPGMSAIAAETARAMTAEYDLQTSIEKEITDRINGDIDLTKEYTMSVASGMNLYNVGGSSVAIDFDGNFGNY